MSQVTRAKIVLLTYPYFKHAVTVIEVAWPCSPLELSLLPLRKLERPRGGFLLQKSPQKSPDTISNHSITRKPQNVTRIAFQFAMEAPDQKLLMAYGLFFAALATLSESKTLPQSRAA